MHRLTDSIIKTINIIINWISGPSPHMPKAQPNIQPKAHIFYYFQCGTQGFSPLIIQFQVNIENINFLFTPCYFFNNHCGAREEGDFGARLWVCLIWDKFIGL